LVILTNDEENIEPDTSQIPKPIDKSQGNEPTLTYYFQNADSEGEFSPGRNVYTDTRQNYTGTPNTQVNTTFQADLKKMVDFLLTDEGKRYKIISQGFTSALNVKTYNKKLGKDRAKALRTYLTDKLVEAETNIEAVPVNASIEGDTKTYPKEITWSNSSLRWAEPESLGEVGDSGQDSPIAGGTIAKEKEAIINNPKAIMARRATITLKPNPNIDAMMLEKTTNSVEQVNKDRQAEYNRKHLINGKSQKLANELVNESTYFNKLKVENSFIYDSLKEKVKYFHPAFHSMTPEGLNGRLTFLEQCTRQGPNKVKNEPRNMAFGKPPICVLRIGDFYHTKIVIDTVNLTFDPLLWDLNPEGIGVQPMLAKVDLNFKFIGGSSLGGPINDLQNAVSFNFFANTSVYNRRKNVTVSDPKQSGGLKGVGVKTDTFGYGSFITPGQVDGTKDSPDIIPENIELSKSKADVNTPAENITEKPVDNIQKAAVSAVEGAVPDDSSFEEEAEKKF